MNDAAFYSYPAVFEFSENLWGVTFPDLENAFCTEDTLEKAILEAKIVLEECLYFREKDHEPIPAPSDVRDVVVPQGGFCQLVVADMNAVRREMSQKAVKKTLTIPFWMEEELKQRPSLNVSALLQRALIKELGLQVPSFR